MNIIPLPDPPPPSPAQRSALSILAHVNSAAGQAVQRQMTLFPAFWDDPNATPDEILFEMKNNATRMMAAAEENKRHLEALAEIAGGELTDLISLEYVIPRREFIPAEDGTATLAPPDEGFDAWGRPIPEEPEEIEAGVGEGDMPEID